MPGVRVFQFSKVMLAVVVAGLMASCGQSPAPVEEETTTSQAAGELQFSDDAARGAYAIGHQLGGTVSGSYPNIDADLLVAGVRDALAGENSLSQEEMRAGVSALAEQAQAARSAREAEQAAEGRAFLESNAARAEVTTTESGLQYEVLEAAGEGNNPKSTDTVVVHYTGKLLDDSVFDSSVERGQPAEFPLNRVIRGWTEGLQLMRAGDKYRFFIPHELGYGARGAGERIPPYSVLVFDVELIEIK